MESKLFRFVPEAVLGFCRYFDDNRPSRFLDFIRKSKLSNLLVECIVNLKGSHFVVCNWELTKNSVNNVQGNVSHNTRGGDGDGVGGRGV